MAQTKTIIVIDYHYDDDTGMYEVGELDWGISGEADTYVKTYGREKLVEHLRKMADLIEERELIPDYSEEEKLALRQKLLDSRLGTDINDNAVKSLSAVDSMRRNSTSER